MRDEPGCSELRDEYKRKQLFPGFAGGETLDFFYLPVYSPMPAEFSLHAVKSDRKHTGWTCGLLSSRYLTFKKMDTPYG
jgi:hypothetical protein